MHKEYHILSETEDGITYLTGLTKYGVSEDNFSLGVNTYWESKTNNGVASSCSYAIQAERDGEKYNMKIRMESHTFYENGVNAGHAHPSGKWGEDDEFCNLIMTYYQQHKEEILIISDQPPELPFPSLLALSESAEQHMIALRKIDTLPHIGNGDFYIEYDLLYVNNVVNYKNELQSYSVSTTLLHFIPHNNRYMLEIKHSPTKLYTQGGTKVEELHFPPYNWEPFNEVPDCYNKVLDYYLQHSDTKDVHKKR